MPEETTSSAARSETQFSSEFEPGPPPVVHDGCSVLLLP